MMRFLSASSSSSQKIFHTILIWFCLLLSAQVSLKISTRIESEKKVGEEKKSNKYSHKFVHELLHVLLTFIASRSHLNAPLSVRDSTNNLNYLSVDLCTSRLSDESNEVETRKTCERSNSHQMIIFRLPIISRQHSSSQFFKHNSINSSLHRHRHHRLLSSVHNLMTLLSFCETDISPPFRFQLRIINIIIILNLKNATSEWWKATQKNSTKKMR